jgi:hypothetical protein
MCTSTGLFVLISHENWCLGPPCSDRASGNIGCCGRRHTGLKVRRSGFRLHCRCRRCVNTVSGRSCLVLPAEAWRLQNSASICVRAGPPAKCDGQSAEEGIEIQVPRYSRQLEVTSSHGSGRPAGTNPADARLHKGVFKSIARFL